MSEMTAPALLRDNLTLMSDKDKIAWNTQRALLDMAEKQDETATMLRRLTEDIRDLRTMVDRVVHR
jgi:hypothetical protein